MKEAITGHTGRVTGRTYYRQYADMLFDKGYAYYAFDTPEELEALRIESEKEGKTFIYNAQIREKLNNSVSLERR